jgi:catechol 2,3-dioxygenase-like lactoylglutathione lyase family enzyme
MALAAEKTAYDVGGVRLARPFKVRRLGHTGFNCIKMEDCVRFYTEDMGFRVSDRLDFTKRAASPKDLEGMGDPGGYFMRHGTDHHSFVLFNKRVREALDKTRRFIPGVTVNQISWQVGSLGEVVNGNDWILGRGMEVQRSGRDMPGSNWHTYFYDPDGHTNELYYGMEQIGWDWHSKPDPMHDRGFREKPGLPQMNEQDEVAKAHAQGVDIHSGSAAPDPLPAKYNVEGILLPRPFKITRIGPLNLFVKDVDAATEFYRSTMGFVVTEEVTWKGKRATFLRTNTEHHSVGLYPLELREALGLRGDTTLMSLGLQLGTYQQLRDARTFLQGRGVKTVEVPAELHPGIDYAFHVTDPDGHALTLYFNMEQIGWDGKPRPTSLRPRVDPRAWPETIDAQSDTYAGETLLGPLG